jgi:hypothetical protein
MFPSAQPELIPIKADIVANRASLIPVLILISPHSSFRVSTGLAASLKTVKKDKNAQVFLNSRARSADWISRPEVELKDRVSHRIRFAGFLAMLGTCVVTPWNALAFSELEYSLERTGAKTKKGRLTLPEGKPATVILNTHTLIRIRARPVEDGTLQVEAEIWDRREGRSRELYAKPIVQVAPGQTVETTGGRAGRGDYRLRIKARNVASQRKPAQESVQAERISTSLFAPRRSWDE